MKNRIRFNLVAAGGLRRVERGVRLEKKFVGLSDKSFMLKAYELYPVRDATRMPFKPPRGIEIVRIDADSLSGPVHSVQIRLKKHSSQARLLPRTARFPL